MASTLNGTGGFCSLRMNIPNANFKVYSRISSLPLVCVCGCSLLNGLYSYILYSVPASYRHIELYLYYSPFTRVYFSATAVEKVYNTVSLYIRDQGGCYIHLIVYISLGTINCYKLQKRRYIIVYCIQKNKKKKKLYLNGNNARRLLLALLSHIN